jgi:hypothetical protein
MAELAESYPTMSPVNKAKVGRYLAPAYTRDSMETKPVGDGTK